MKEIINDNKLLEGLRSRYAVKKFDSNIRLKKSKEILIKEILQLTPTSFGLQLHKYLIVKDQKIREELKKYSWNQWQIVDSDFIIVFCVKDNFNINNIKEHTKNIQKVRWIDNEKRDGITAFMENEILIKRELDPLKNIENWQTRQAYIALWNIMTSASLVWIDTCPIEWMDCKKYDEILWLKKLWLISKVVLAIGTRSIDDKYQNEKKVRFPQSELFLEI